jgi:hypothetical protein
MAAIKKINEPEQCRQRHRRQRITLYVARLTHGELHSSAPCFHCMRAIQLCPYIKRIIYSEADGSITRCSPHEFCTQHVSWGLRDMRQRHVRAGRCVPPQTPPLLNYAVLARRAVPWKPGFPD